MSVHVYNEIGPLDTVLVHAPGPEVGRMTQHELERLLFDDLLAPPVALAEHRVLCEILGTFGADVLQVRDLLADALQAAPPEAVVDLLETVCRQACATEIGPMLAGLDAVTLAKGLIEGVRWSGLPAAPQTLARLADIHDGWALPPIPNLMFMRDPCFSVYDRVVVGRMCTDARRRESLLVHFALRHGYQSPPAFLFDQSDWALPSAYRSIEGGDVLVINERMLMIGVSERTRAATVERLAREALFPQFPELESVYAVLMPAERSVMHLDTILTQVDSGLFLGHKPMMVDGETVRVARIPRNGAPEVLAGATVADVLRNELGPKTQVVPCGGHERLHQDREQWTDGANAVCIAPGHIVLYARNVRTVQTLVEEHGFYALELSASQSPAVRAEKLADAKGHGRVAYTFVGSELSRARGGGRCLSMPLYRGR